MIITKSISRFARNTGDTFKKYVRIVKKERKEHSSIFCRRKYKYIRNVVANLYYTTILSSVAQQESENISNHVKLGI